ncbi:MAG: cell division protein ZapA [Treponema sp.]|jgi:cell division protein ZapA (FtsZ GTPase activity inhibitor)|nr:cell division protein ZapA [Treponema sp.]
MKASSLTIDVLGVSLSISAEEDAKYLDKILERYRLAILDTQQKTGLADNHELAILTGFLLVEELYKAEEQLSAWKLAEENEFKEAERLTQDMISRIDDVLEKKDDY